MKQHPPTVRAARLKNQMRISSVNHVQFTIPPDRVAEARTFYCGVMGMIEKPKPPTFGGTRGFWLDAGGFEVHVGVEEFDRTQTKAHVAYEVENLEAWRARLTALGLEPNDAQPPIPGFRRFQFRDPFGNLVELMQRCS